MEKARIYRKGRRVIYIYVVIIVIAMALLLRQLMLYFNMDELHTVFHDTTYKMGIELFIQSAFSVSPNLEYLSTTQTNGTTEKLNYMMVFTNNFIPVLSYLVDTDIKSYDYMCEIYPFLEAQVKDEENTVETFAEDERFIVKEGSDSIAVQATPYTLAQLSDYTFLLNNIYTVDTNVISDPSLFDVNYFINKNLKIDSTVDGPQILIYHTHSQESFIDSQPGEKGDTIVGVGDDLTKLLEEKYGLKIYHLREEFDMIDGVLDRSRAYDLIEVRIKQILKENPSIQVCIDLHRDGIPADTKFVTTIDGKSTAKLMFFNGISKTKKDGKMVDVASMPNPYVKDNMSFSLQMHLKATELYPGLTRKIYLKAYRYNLHNLPRSLLIEVGAQTNTVEEEKNAMIPLAEILYQVVVK